MAGVNLSSLVRAQQKLPISDLLNAVAARRSQMRELASNIQYLHKRYVAKLAEVEQGKDALLTYTQLDSINMDGEELTQLCRSLHDLRSGIRSYSHRLGEALPRATEDLLRRGNAILFEHPTSAGAMYMLGYSEGDTSEYVVESLGGGESPDVVVNNEARIQSTQQLLDAPELAACLSFFGE